MVASNQTIQNNFKRYLLPGALTFVLVLLLSLGGLYLRGFFMEQVAQERSSQLKEMSGQICVNLDYNLETHWNLVTGLKGELRRKEFHNEAEVQRGIADLESMFRADLYGCRLMLLDSMGMAYTTDGTVGIWDDVKFFGRWRLSSHLCFGYQQCEGHLFSILPKAVRHHQRG